MTIKVHLTSQSTRMTKHNVRNAYTKDGLYCIYMEDGIVIKYPLCNIFEITEITDG